MKLYPFLAIALFALPGRSFGADKAACIEAHAGAQADRRQGHLRAAREKLVTCSAEGCPGVIRTECGQALSEVTRDLPTVIFSAKDAGGKSLSAVTIREGDVVLDENLSGKAVPLDPGSHKLVATLSTGEKTSMEAVVRTGDRNLPLVVEFSELNAAPKAKEPPPETKPPTTTTSRPIPAAFFVAGGVALVGTGVFVGFALDGKSKESSFDTCKPYCETSAYDDMRRSYLIADIGLGVAVVSAGLATYFLVTRPETTSSARRLDVAPTLARDGGGASLFGTF